jgi:xanthine dehydrogenase accessory factor
MKTLIHTLLDILGQGRKAALATILTHDGSTPRTSGSRMLVLDDGTIRGTIGGGLVEAEAITRARSLMEQGRHAIVAFRLNDRVRESLDMVCGGSLTVFIETPGPESLALYRALEREIREGRPCRRVTEASGPDDDLSLRPGLEGTNGLLAGEDLVPASLAGSGLESVDGAPRVVRFGDRRLILEPVEIVKTLFLFGGGHVSQAVARIGAMLEFRVVVVDDRAEFATSERFPDAAECRVVETFPEFFGPVAVDGDGYVVILTRGHLHDQTVLAHALKTPAVYIGMIGSRSKRDRIYANLLEQGFSRADLDRVHSPVGLEINAETPAEIAVSIAAELVSVVRSRS